jgi:hypothetical protein
MVDDRRSRLRSTSTWVRVQRIAVHSMCSTPSLSHTIRAVMGVLRAGRAPVFVEDALSG